MVADREVLTTASFFVYAKQPERDAADMKGGVRPRQGAARKPRYLRSKADRKCRMYALDVVTQCLSSDGTSHLRSSTAVDLPGPTEASSSARRQGKGGLPKVNSPHSASGVQAQFGAISSMGSVVHVPSSAVPVGGHKRLREASGQREQSVTSSEWVALKNAMSALTLPAAGASGFPLKI